MAKVAKERILAAALAMFSQKGYADTNIRELTASVGLVKSSMDKYLASKEEIWNTLRDELIGYYNSHFGFPEHLPPVPDTLEELVNLTMQMAVLRSRMKRSFCPENCLQSSSSVMDGQAILRQSTF